MTIDETIKHYQGLLYCTKAHKAYLKEFLSSTPREDERIERYTLVVSALRAQQEQWKNDPLTLEELMAMDAPVWCLCKPIEGGNGYWCLCRKGHITTPAGSHYYVPEIPHWVFLRNKPEEDIPQEKNRPV